MKKITILLLLLFTVACKHQEKETSNDSNTVSPLLSIADSLSGEWIYKDYIESIQKTKSVYLNRNTVVPLFIILNRDELQKENPIIHGFTSHEGGYDVNIIYDKNKLSFLVNGKTEDPTYKDFIGLKTNKQTLEMIYNDKVEVYKKMNDNLQSELRKILFEGSYKDSNSSNITFKRNGKVDFKDYVNYEVIYDFADEVQKFDGVLFEKNDSTKDLYKFNISEDKIELQQMNEDSNRNFIPKGEKYILKK